MSQDIHMLDFRAKARAEREHRAALQTACCNGNCRQGRDCPKHAPVERAMHPLRLSSEALELGTRRSPLRKMQRAWRSLWRYLMGPSPW